jgi:hypothetical protein
VLAHAARAAAGPVYDPTREEDLTRKWTPAHRADVVQAFTELAKLADEARLLEGRGQVQAAIELWHRVCGDSFPAGAAESAEEALRNWNGGSITKAGRVVPVVLPAAPSYRPSRAWRSA